MSSRGSSKVTSACTTYEADKALYEELLARSRTTDAITMLTELLALALQDPEQFDRCERVRKEPFISFAHVCSMQSELSTKKQTCKPSAPSNTVHAPSRRSARVAEKQKLELSQPLAGITIFEGNTGSALSNSSRVPRKRKAPLKDANMAPILNCSSEEQVPKRPVKRVRLIVNERPNQS